jgi:MFS transporter, DHA1 family, multidrug resistance protein
VTEAERPARPLLAAAPVYLSVFFLISGNSALSVLVPIFLSREAHLGTATIGLTVGVYGAAALATRLPVGLVYTAARGQRLLLVGAAICAAAYALVPLGEGAVQLAALLALNGFGWSMATTAQLALLVGRPPSGASTASAIGWFAGATALGSMAGGALGGVTADAIGLRSTFFLLAATPLLAALLMVRRVRRSKAFAPVETTPRVSDGPAWRLLLRMPLPVWAGVLVMFFINGLNALTQTFHPLLALAAGLSITQIGVLSSIRSWSSGTSRFGSGPLFARLDAAALTLPLVVVGTLAVVLIPSAIESFALQIPLFAMAGLSRGLLRVTGSADAFEAVGSDDRRHGLISALLYAGLDLGKIVLPVVGGVVAGAWGIATMFRVVPLGLFVLYLALALPARRAAVTRLGVSPR